MEQGALQRVWRGVFGPLLGLLLAACSGGGGSAPSAVTNGAVPPASGNAKAFARATLTWRFPANFHTATAVKRKAATAARRPAYVNPTAGSLLDIYVDGTLQLNLDAVTPSHSVTIVPTPDGTQTLNLPLLQQIPTSRDRMIQPIAPFWRSAKFRE